MSLRRILKRADRKAKKKHSNATFFAVFNNPTERIDVRLAALNCLGGHEFPESTIRVMRAELLWGTP